MRIEARLAELGTHAADRRREGVAGIRLASSASMRMLGERALIRRTRSPGLRMAADGAVRQGGRGGQRSRRLRGCAAVSRCR